MSQNQLSFVHLHLHSAYSLAEGAIKIKDLIKHCKAQNMPAVAVTDTNNMFGAMEFALEAASNGVQPILGAQVSYGPFESQICSQIVLIVQNEQGYRNLSRLLSDGFMNGEDGFHPLTAQNLEDAHEGLICLSGGSKGPINQALFHNQDEEAVRALQSLKTIFGDRFYIELQRHGLEEENAAEERLIDLAYQHDVPLVATNDCYFLAPNIHEAHDALLCISEGRYVTEEDRRKVTKQHYFKSSEEMVKLFEDVPEAIANTAVIVQRCSYLLEPIDPLLPTFSKDEQAELAQQAEDGLKWRLENFVADGTEQKPYFDRLEYELGVINQMGFPGYFLIVSDFIKWAKEQNIPVGPGRGSGAGSVVAWSLQITDLDPLELNLLFERFLNPERVSMPDFDIDFCQERRDEVIKYVQDKYGHDQVAQIITFGKLQARAVVRDVGRVLQMPYGQVDRIAKMIPNNPANPMTLEEALASDEDLRAERDKDDTNKKLIDIALQLEGLYRHASTHAAGVVIGDRPLQELVPLYRDPRSDMPVTQFNMKYVEQVGLVKFDFLGLKTMTVVQRSIDLVNETLETPIELLKIPLDDEKAYDLIARGDTVGVFQLESAGMRDALRKTRPNRFEDIVALVSLYRPGPMDNIPRYAAIKDGKEEPDYMHPKLEPLLKETFGIMIYQEQVMQAAQELAGYTLGGADLLRRAMGKKIQAEMDAQREMFVQGANDNNEVLEEQASAIFDQIAKFAGYGFNKSHAAAYALIAYWTAWLKANYPVEFMCASMMLDLGNTDKLAVFKQDLDKMGVPVRTPDMNKSGADFLVEEGGIRYALAALKGVGEAAMEDIVVERDANGTFASIQDFTSRINPKSLNKRQLEQLGSAGAFECFGVHRAQMHEAAEMVLRHANSLAEERESGQENLFGGGDSGPGLDMPPLPTVTKWDPLEQLAKEFSAVGFYLSAHPLDTKLAQLERMKIATYAEMMVELEEKMAVRKQLAGVLLKKQEKMSQKGSKYAFLQLSDTTGVYELMIFSELLAATREILVPGTALLLSADAEMKEDQVRMTAHTLQPLDEALEGKIAQIEITLDESTPLPKLKEFLDAEGQGRCKIALFVHTNDNKKVEIEIPGRWLLSAQARNDLRMKNGIINISET